MSKALLVLAVLLAFTGCGSGVAGGRQPSKREDLHGQARAQVLTTLGAPTRAEKYRMSEALGEFRVELQNTYPIAGGANDDVEIEELTWKQGNYWLTVWLHRVDDEWIVLDTCRWHNDVRF